MHHPPTKCVDEQDKCHTRCIYVCIYMYNTRKGEVLRVRSLATYDAQATTKCNLACPLNPFTGALFLYINLNPSLIPSNITTGVQS